VNVALPYIFKKQKKMFYNRFFVIFTIKKALAEHPPGPRVQEVIFILGDNFQN